MITLNKSRNQELTNRAGGAFKSASFKGLGLKAAAMSAALVLVLATGTIAQAQSDSPVGLWKTIDDDTKEARSLVRITETGGQLSGRIEKILSDKPDAVCEQCSGELKDKPVRGMTILRGLKKGEEWWEGGSILDPNNGKTYRSRLKVLEGGNKLELRGYIGTPLLGRTQIWVREGQ
jgi:uncharacterized protein (DUF2147 family)